MSDSLGRINLLHLFFATFFLASLAFFVVFVLMGSPVSYSAVKPVVSDRVSSEDIVVEFSSLKSSYTAGEAATFHIDILNLGSSPISRINFSLNVRAMSLYGLNVFSMEGYSKRTFVPGRLERIRISPEDVIEVDLPELIPPGFYILDLSIQPVSLKAPPKSSLIIYVAASAHTTTVFSTLFVFSGAVCLLLFIGSHIDISDLSRMYGGKPLYFLKFSRVYVQILYPRLVRVRLPVYLPKFSIAYAWRKLASLAYLINIKSTEADIALKKILMGFSTGQKFVFLGMVAIVATAFPQMLRYEGFVNDLAILAYFSLTIGVLNLIWEARSRVTNSRLPIRTLLSLVALGLLMYPSNSNFTYMIILIALYLLVLKLRTISNRVH